MTVLSSLQSLDVHALDFVRSTLTINAPWFHTFIKLFSDSEPIAFALFLVGLWLSGVYKKSEKPKHVALDLFWHVLGAFIIYSIINQVFPVRPRPETLSSLPPLISHIPDNSFPSGHAIFWAASWWSLFVFFHSKKTVWAFFTLGLITCLVRIIAGIHYPGDIIVGFFLGWYITYLLIHLPHGKRYQHYAHDMPIKFFSFFKL